MKELSLGIEALNIDQKAFSALKENGIETIDDVLSVGFYDVSKIKNIGLSVIGLILIGLDYFDIPIPNSIKVYDKQKRRIRTVESSELINKYKGSKMHKQNFEGVRFRINEDRIKIRTKAKSIAREACNLLSSEFSELVNIPENRQYREDVEECFWNTIQEKLHPFIQSYCNVKVETNSVRSKIKPMDSTRVKLFEKTEMPFGKFVGMKVSDVPLKYLSNLGDGFGFMVKLVSYIKSELVRKELLMEGLID